jgi:WD40 repeat protein
VRVPIGTDVPGIALSPDGQFLYTSEPLTAYKVATGERIWRREEVASNYGAFDINAEGTLLVLGDLSGKDGLLVNVEDGDTVATLNGHASGIWDIRFSPDGTLVGSTSSDGELIVWDTATARPRERWGTLDPVGVGFSPDNDLVYNGYGTSMLRTWDLSVEDTYLQQTTQVGDAGVFRQADFSPDGQQVAYGWRDDQDRGWVRFVDAVTGDTTSPTRFPVWDDARLWTNGAWHPDGGRYAGYWCDDNQDTCATPGTVTVLDSATGQPLRKPTDVVDGDGDIYSLAYVDGSRSLLAVDSDVKAHILDAETLRPRGEPFDISTFCPCATTPVGDASTALVWEWSGGGASTLWRVLDVNTGEVLSEGGDLDLLAHTSVAAPDGSTVAVAGDTGEIASIDVSTGHEQRRSSSLGAEVWSLNYSDDGELLVSGAEDGGVSLWDAATLELLGTVYPPHLGKPVPAGAQFIGDTHDVAIASHDGRVYRWETDLDRALDFACQMAGRNLTEAEWAEFLPAQPYQSVCPDQ